MSATAPQPEELHIMIESVYNAILSAATDAGDAAGINAATNVVDSSNAQRYLDGIEEGDPEILDTLPSLDLSGQWVDGLTARDVLDAIAGKIPERADYLDAAVLDPDTGDAFVTAYVDAFDTAVHDKIGTDAAEILRSVLLDEIEGFTAFRLANECDAACPDSDKSAGGQFLISVRDAFLESVRGGYWTGSDSAHEIADNAPDVYTATLWAEFVDLAAYRESDDANELTADDASMEGRARVCLYVIAEHLAMRLAELAEIEV